MAEYEIISKFDQGGKAAYRKRWDAAKLQLQKQIYDVMDAFSLRDKQIAHDFMNWAKHLPPPAKGCGEYGRGIAGFYFSVERLS